MSVSYLARIVVLLVEVTESIEILSKFLPTCKTLYNTLILDDRVWLVAANTLSCKVCLHQAISAAPFSSLDSASYWFDTAKSFAAQTRLRRQWNIIFCSGVYVNSGKRKVVVRTESVSATTISTTSRRESFISRQLERIKNIFHPSASNLTFANIEFVSQNEYGGDKLIFLLDTFVENERHMLMSTEKDMRHWHDLSQCDTELKRSLVNGDRRCSPSLQIPSVPFMSFMCRLTSWTELIFTSDDDQSVHTLACSSTAQGPLRPHCGHVCSALNNEQMRWLSHSSLLLPGLTRRRRERYAAQSVRPFEPRTGSCCGARLLTNEAALQLRDLCEAAGQGGTESMPTRLFASYLSNRKGSERRLSGRLVVVAVCFSDNGAVVRMCALTSARKSFRWTPV